jgi:hypothetical protein
MGKGGSLQKSCSDSASVSSQREGSGWCCRSGDAGFLQLWPTAERSGAVRGKRMQRLLGGPSRRAGAGWLSGSDQVGLTGLVHEEKKTYFLNSYSFSIQHRSKDKSRKKYLGQSEKYEKNSGYRLEYLEQHLHWTL